MALIVHFKMIALCYIDFPSIKRREERKGGREERSERTKPKGAPVRGNWVSIRESRGGGHLSGPGSGAAGMQSRGWWPVSHPPPTSPPSHTLFGPHGSRGAARKASSDH